MPADVGPQPGRLVLGTGRLGPPPGVPVVIDPALPLSPGFEVVRARPETAAA